MELMKIDLLKTDPIYYKAGKSPRITDLDTYDYLTVSGQSAPEDPAFGTAIESLYTVAYAVKFLCKGEDNDFVIPKMEAFWYVNGGPEVQHLFPQTPRNQWMWQILIRMPDAVDQDHYLRSMGNLKTGKKDVSPVKFEPIDGGKFVSILHLGSYEDETLSLQKLHEFIDAENYELYGYHREIYLSDPRRTPEDRLRTILRYRIRHKQ